MKRILALCLLISPHLAFANDTAFGGEGSAPMPIEQTHVQMVAEHVVIKGNDINRDDFKGQWQVTGDYTFKNLSDSPQSFKMGFPFPVYGYVEEIISTPAGYSVKQGSPLVYNFSVSVDGVPVKITKTKITPRVDKQLDYHDAYIWDIKMNPKQTIKVHHYFVTGITFNSVGQNWVAYVLKTGGLWHGGKIGLANLEVLPNTKTRTCSELEKNPEEFLKPTPVGMSIANVGANRKYFWTLHQFTPKDDLSLCLITGKNYVRYYIVYPVIQNNRYFDITKMNATQLRQLRNTIFAQYGRRFDDPELQNYFNQQWWYEPNDHYSDQLLNEDDKKALAMIK